MRLNDFLIESINDRALLKAVFFVGYPGSGKTTLSKLLMDGSLPIMSISSDIWAEFLGDKDDGCDELQSWTLDFEQKVKSLTMKKIVSNTDGLLPIFVDTTGSNLKNFQDRVNVLKDLGYDVSLVIVNVKPETSVERVSKRNSEICRQVEDKFLKQAFTKISKAIPKFKSVIPDNITIDNDNITDADILKGYRAVVKFFNTPIKNPKGKKLVDFMRQNGYKYYREVPKEWRYKNGFPDLDNNSMKWFKH